MQQRKLQKSRLNKSARIMLIQFYYIDENIIIPESVRYIKTFLFYSHRLSITRFFFFKNYITREYFLYLHFQATIITEPKYIKYAAEMVSGEPEVEAITWKCEIYGIETGASLINQVISDGSRFWITLMQDARFFIEQEREFWKIVAIHFDLNIARDALIYTRTLQSIINWYNNAYYLPYNVIDINWYIVNQTWCQMEYYIEEIILRKTISTGVIRKFLLAC